MQSPIVVIPFEARGHYHIVSKWWNSQQWPAIPLEMLPQTGFLAVSGGKPVAACWLYKTDSHIALLEWMIGDPEAAPKLRGDAQNLLIEQATREAQELGFKALFTMSQHARLIERLRTQHGFKVTDKGMTHLIRFI